MATKRRTELKALFKNGGIPTAQHFADLIDSSVNKRDDHFFGYWQPGVAYYPGDVVIAGKSLYMLLSKAAKPSPTPAGKAARNADTPTDTGPESYCSATPPDQDLRWCLLDFDLQDDDWTIAPGNDFMYASNLDHLVGIGTDCPMAKLEVVEAERGKLEFNPHGSEHYADKETELRLTACDLPDCEEPPFLSLHLDGDFAHAETNTRKGFSFDYLNPNLQTLQPQQQQSAKSAALLPQGPLTLMVVTGGDANKAEVGIGLTEPSATLHVGDAGKGEWMVNPTAGRVAETRLLGLEGEFVSQKLDEGFADFGTNAAQGFRFNTERRGQSKKGSLAVVIDENNHLGVGTQAPETHLEVRQEDCGSVQACLEQINPALAIVNLDLREEGTNTYLTLGVDNSFAVLKTDAPCGFVLKRGDPHGDPGHPERNVNQGDGQVFVDQNGKVGIGIAPDVYELDTLGKTRSYEAYLAHDQRNLRNVKPLKDGEGLDIVCNLHPIRFKWRTNLGDAVTQQGEQFGLQDYECADVAPEIVRITDKDEKALAYQNLVPVLIKAIQEQQKTIDDLARRITYLENTGKTY